MIARTCFACCLAGLAGLAPTLGSAETIGRITASIDGAEERTFYANMIDGESQSFWVETMPGSLSHSGFGIWANPEEGVNAQDDVLILGGTLIRGPSGYVAVGDAQYLESGFTEYWTAEDEGLVAFEITRAEIVDDALVVEGSFVAPLTYAEGADAVLDLSRQITVTGSFEATLPKN